LTVALNKEPDQAKPVGTHEAVSPRRACASRLREQHLSKQHLCDATCVPGSGIAALNAGLRESLGAGEPPAGLTHRFSGWQEVEGELLATLALADVTDYDA
jgi:hypothetical protein